MFKRLGIAFAFCIIIGSTAGAQDRIAVLDTVLPKGMDAGVVIPVTEKIMEEFVRSKLFIVLDRSFISKTLSEQEFSTSDLTSGDSAKLATIGGFLKATYIVVSTVQKLDTRYFLSAKMIEVKSGVIVAQSSVDRDGTISVLISMAGELGQKLVAASMGQEAPKSSGRTAAQPTQSTAPEQSGPPAQATEPRPSRAAKPSTGRFASVSIDVGTAETIANETGTEYNYFTFINGDYDPVPGLYYGIYALQPFDLFYCSANLGLTTAEYDGGLAYVNSDAFQLGLGLGLDVPFGPVLTYAGVRGGYAVFTLYESYYAGSDYETTWAGMSYGFEVGCDVRLGRFSLGLRYQLDTGTLSDIDGSYPDMDATTASLALRVGYTF